MKAGWPSPKSVCRGINPRQTDTQTGLPAATHGGAGALPGGPDDLRVAALPLRTLRIYSASLSGSRSSEAARVRREEESPGGPSHVTKPHTGSRAKGTEPTLYGL